MAVAETVFDVWGLDAEERDQLARLATLYKERAETSKQKSRANLILRSLWDYAHMHEVSDGLIAFAALEMVEQQIKQDLSPESQALWMRMKDKIESYP